MAVYNGNSLTGNERFAIGDIINFEYSGLVKNLMLSSGKFKLECWGGQGGYRSSITYGGKGGYAVGEIDLSQRQAIYVHTGASGNTRGTGVNNVSFNGGGYKQNYYGGGDASDIRISTDSLYARVIVAGGGGSDGASNKTGGYAGGTSGQSITASYGTGGYGGTQTGNTWLTSEQQTTATTSSSNCYAGFGFGGNGVYRSSGYGGAGGGGWYGGSGSYPDGSGDDDRGGGGGSSFILTSSTVSNTPTDYLLDNNYYLSNATVSSGNTSFIQPEGNTATGRSGNGYVRITVIELYSQLNIGVNINGIWKTSDEAYVNLDGLWKPIEKIYVKVDNEWKENV